MDNIQMLENKKLNFWKCISDICIRKHDSTVFVFVLYLIDMFVF